MLHLYREALWDRTQNRSSVYSEKLKLNSNMSFVRLSGGSIMSCSFKEHKYKLKVRLRNGRPDLTPSEVLLRDLRQAAVDIRVTQTVTKGPQMPPRWCAELTNRYQECGVNVAEWQQLVKAHGDVPVMSRSKVITFRERDCKRDVSRVMKRVFVTDHSVDYLSLNSSLGEVSLHRLIVDSWS